MTTMYIEYDDMMTESDAQYLASALRSERVLGAEAADLAGGFYGVTVPASEGADALITAYRGTLECETSDGEIIDVPAPCVDIIVTLQDADGEIPESQQQRESVPSETVATVREMIAAALESVR